MFLWIFAVIICGSCGGRKRNPGQQARISGIRCLSGHEAYPAGASSIPDHVTLCNRQTALGFIRNGGQDLGLTFVTASSNCVNDCAVSQSGTNSITGKSAANNFFRSKPVSESQVKKSWSFWRGYIFSERPRFSKGGQVGRPHLQPATCNQQCRDSRLWVSPILRLRYDALRNILPK